MTKTYIPTGNTLLDQAMKGGIPGIILKTKLINL